MAKTVAIIQARYNSTRFPGKVMQYIKPTGRTILRHVIDRVNGAKNVALVVVAIPPTREDMQLVREALWVDKAQIFVGSEFDVLERFTQAAKLYCNRDDVILRITADCPLIDPKLIDITVSEYLDHDGKCYVATRMDPDAFPDGMDVEAFSLDMIREANIQAVTTYDREHVTPWIKRNFPCINVRSTGNMGQIRCTVDVPEDMEFITDLCKAFYHDNPLFGLREILSYIRGEG